MTTEQGGLQREPKAKLSEPTQAGQAAIGTPDDPPMTPKKPRPVGF